ncbi:MULTISPECIES: hypothetical protein [Streptomyces violaceusniger group]|uniref:hypothetical protein n=1 Tax=Streptomyces violaceusniger group TaxID=2839105 RepID=UPI00355615BE
MDAQFARLVELAQLPNTVLQVAPQSCGSRFRIGSRFRSVWASRLGRVRVSSRAFGAIEQRRRGRGARTASPGAGPVDASVGGGTCARELGRIPD